MCHVLRVCRSGYYAWLKTPHSKRALDNMALLDEIKQFYAASGNIYGSPRIYRAIRGYRKARYKAGKPAIAAPNRLRQVFVATAPDEAWVTDITQIYTHEGWLYLAAVIDLYSRAVVGWSMQGHTRTELVLDAMLMAKWRRQPKQAVVIHSDQGSQFGSDAFNRWCKENNFITSMSRRGNCYDNAAMESFFSSLKKEKIRRKIFNTREELKAEIFDYIEVFYNKVRRHSYLNYLSPVQFEQQQIGH
jgi:putative transposase